MCGIIGAVSAGRLPSRGEAQARAMNAAIRHRGPDDEGVYRDARAMIGMRRLAIIDVGGGHQPVHNEDGGIQAVFNGEIYNYRALRAELERAGHQFYTQSDSEVIVHAYEAWGERCFTRLEGMFAIAIWDVRQQRLLLARDRLGKKPLFLWQRDDELVFASELKSLLALPEFERSVDLSVLDAYVAFGYVPTPHSIFRDVRKLKPGHFAVYEGGRLREQAYWRLEFGPTFVGDEARATEELASLLERAVDDRLVSDVPFGAFLSGGLDSSVVVALMARRMKQPVKTFSIGFREARYNELSDARRVAEHLGTEHHELVVEPDAVELMEKLVWHLDEPFADASAVPTFLVSELAGRHVKMVLSGDGGDEAFGGYDRYLRFLRLESLGAFKPLMAVGLRGAAVLAGGARAFRWRRIAERLRLSFPDSYLSGVALSRPEFVRELLGSRAREQPYRALDHAMTLGADANWLDRVVDIDIGSYLLDDILVKLDRMSMAASIEGRAPLLDHRLVEFAVRLPASMRVRDGRGKHLLRRVASRWLPPAVLDKPKQGFGIPLPEWFRGPLRELAADVLGSRAFRERGWLSPAVAQRCLHDHARGAADLSEPLWLMLCLELWARRFIDRDASATRTTRVAVDA